jgi:hypothetical protein
VRFNAVASSSMYTLPSRSSKRVMLKSAKGADARRETRQELTKKFRGALDTVPVLREFLKSRQMKPLPSPSGSPGQL